MTILSLCVAVLAAYSIIATDYLCTLVKDNGKRIQDSISGLDKDIKYERDRRQEACMRAATSIDELAAASGFIWVNQMTNGHYTKVNNKAK